MSGLESIVCDKCGHSVAGDAKLGLDFRREYNGRDVCVSCFVDLRLENGDYSA